MIFDVYFAFRNNEGKVCPGVKPYPMEWNDIRKKVLEDEKKVKEKILAYRNGDDEAKRWLPSINFVGKSTGSRKAANMIPTQLVMIDIDHCEKPREAWDEIKKYFSDEWLMNNIFLVHITPSGRGLHIIFANQGYDSLKENMDWLDNLCNFSQYGDYDTKVKDYSRVSFACLPDEILFESTWLYMNTEPEIPQTLKNDFYEEPQTTSNKVSNQSDKKDESTNGKVASSKTKSGTDDIPVITPEKAAKYDVADWRGVSLKAIISKWVEYRGEPGENEIHNYYNEMIKYFRNIMGNNKELLFYLLPRFGHTAEECWSQIKSICRVNTLSNIDKPFYFFLKDNGFYVANYKTSMDNYMLAEDVAGDVPPMPLLPPVFREFVRSAPADFRVPLINALMPMLGTLTSYLQAVYPYDDQLHTTSFFSIIYAPPGTGKGFISRLNFIFDDLRLRDQVQQAREDIYLRILNRKSQNDKSPERPNTSLRIIPPKNSEAEFLEKQRDNHGYHMFTYAAEMDSWAKGEKAAGGNKSDMIRIAWDNGEYGQQFKSPTTFKGKVNLYWNVLITGTQDQVERYFKNVENGLVTRCAFSSIDNQEFVLASIWKPIPKKGMEIIKNFMKRCDENTYEEPCTVAWDEALMYSDEEEFEQNIKWRFKFKEKQTIDMSWIMPVINQFHEEECKRALLDLDRARDVFRRRVGVRGFRLALLCTALYPTLNSRAMETIKGFVKWWMVVDLNNMLRLWGKKYNDVATVKPQMYNRDAFASLKDTFTKTDLLVVMKQQGILSPVRNVIYQWKKSGYITRIDKETYKKTKKYEQGEQNNTQG